MKVRQSNTKAPVLTAAILVAVAVHYFFGPTQPEAGELTQANRNEIAMTYIGMQDNPEFDFVKQWGPELKRRIETGKDLDSQGLPIAMLFAMENQNEDYQDILSKLPKDQAAILDYAFAGKGRLPNQWEEQLGEDWFATRLKILVHERLDNSKALVPLRIRQSTLESNTRRHFEMRYMLNLLGLLGVGLLVSMYITSRQFKAMGRPFFLLSPILVPLPYLQRFFAAFLLSFVFIDIGMGSAMADQPYWLRHVATYITQVVVGIYLLQSLMFNHTQASLTDALNMTQIEMRFSTLFKIVGAVAILLACQLFAQIVALGFNWPLPNSNQEAYATILSSPLSGGAYMIVACLIAPIFEELLFRGLLFRGLLALTTPRWALFLSSAVFAMLHPMAVWPYAFAMGFGLAVSYYRSGNLLINIWAHGLWNCIILMTTAGALPT